MQWHSCDQRCVYKYILTVVRHEKKKKWTSKDIHLYEEFPTLEKGIERLLSFKELNGVINYSWIIIDEASAACNFDFVDENIRYTAIIYRYYIRKEDYKNGKFKEGLIGGL